MAKILIVDDDLVSLLYMEQILSSLGHKVIDKAKSGPEGVKKAKKHIPEIVFMDISMPGEYDGIEAARIIESTYNIPIIFITAYEIDQFLNRVQEVQPFGYIMKPFKEVEVKASIYIALYRKQMENKLKNAIKKHKRSLYFQILISNMLVELNKSFDSYEKIDDFINKTRETMELDILGIYEIEKDFILIKNNVSKDKKYKNLNFPDVIDLTENLKNKKINKRVLETIIQVKDINDFPEVIKKIAVKNDVKSVISNPLFVDNKLYGLMITANINNDKLSIDIRRNLKAVSKAISLIITRHFDFLKIQEIEKEKMIKEKIDIRRERLATLGQLTSAITHEVNQPLQSIKLLSESPLFWLKENKQLSTDKLITNFKKIAERVKRINEIIINLRHLIQSPDKIKIEPNNINKIIKKLSSLIEVKLKNNGIKLILELDVKMKDVLICNIQFQQVITDIVDNAVKALNRLDKKDKKIIIKTVQHKDFVTLEIIDNGPGIEQEIKEKIFEPFFSVNPENESMGLGLYIVYNILNTFESQIKVLDNEYKGATFLIKIKNV